MNRNPLSSDWSHLPLGGLAIGVLLSLAACSCSYSTVSDQVELETIATSILNYRRTYHEFPPIIVTDADGNPLHSWRVLILPMMGANEFFSEYDFDSAWNSESNVDLRDGTRKANRAERPAPAEAGRNYLSRESPHMLETIFVALACGPLREEPFLQGNKTPEIGHYLPTGQPFVILEIKGSGIHWMEPRDVKMNLSSFPDWNDVGDLRARIVRSVEVSETGRQVREHDETLTFLDQLRERH